MQTNRISASDYWNKGVEDRQFITGATTATTATSTVKRDAGTKSGTKRELQVTERALRRRVLRNQIVKIEAFRCLFCDHPCCLCFNRREKTITFDHGCSCLVDPEGDGIEDHDWGSAASCLKRLEWHGREKLNVIRIDGTEAQIQAGSIMELQEIEKIE